MLRYSILATCFLLMAGLVQGQDRATEVRNDRETVQADESWIYNDLPAARAEAKKTGKPLLVVIRCIP